MKKTFKFMALAMVAGAMMFAGCKKDDDDNTANNGGNNNNPDATPEVIVTFDGTAHSLAMVGAEFTTDYNWCQMIGYDDMNLTNRTQLIVDGEMDDAAKSTFVKPWNMTAAQFNDSYSYLGYSSDVNKMTTETEDGVTYSMDEYMHQSVNSLNISEFDATTLKMNASLSATMASYYEYANGTAIDQVTRKNLALSIVNIDMAPTTNLTKAHRARIANPFCK